MSDPKVRVVIPFRDRGLDPRRAENLSVVMAWWWMHSFTPQIVDDGGKGDAQFNRHRAYNKAVEQFPETDVFVFTEADMLIHPSQIALGVRLAVERPGLVVPFTRYQYLSDTMTEVVRDAWGRLPTEQIVRWWSAPVEDPASVFSIMPESVMDNGRSIGAVNIVSRETLEMTGGYTEATEGNWYDDRIIEEGFRYMTGNDTTYVPGPAVHMYHLPGWTGEHLSEADRNATARNKSLLVTMRADIKTDNRERVKRLLAYREGR